MIAWSIRASHPAASGDLDQAAQSYEILNSLGLGRRFYIRFRPDTKVTWDFGKIPGAGTDADPLRPKP